MCTGSERASWSARLSPELLARSMNTVERQRQISVDNHAPLRCTSGDVRGGRTRADSSARCSRESPDPRYSVCGEDGSRATPPVERYIVVSIIEQGKSSLAVEAQREASRCWREVGMFPRQPRSEPQDVPESGTDNQSKPLPAWLGAPGASPAAKANGFNVSLDSRGDILTLR
jgi:hypothetical protein